MVQVAQQMCPVADECSFVTKPLLCLSLLSRLTTTP